MKKVKKNKANICQICGGKNGWHKFAHHEQINPNKKSE